MNIMNPKISVIVPAYNVAPWIGRCLDSILAQSYQNLEVIVINDGSTDETGNIVNAYATNDSRVRVIHQKNGGLVAAREVGIARATGEYVTFVDGDDAIESDMYERLLSNAIRYDAEISHCGVSFVYPDGKMEPHYGTGKIKVQDTFTGVKELLLGENVEPSLCTKLYARQLLVDSCLDATVLNNEDLLRNFTLFTRAKRSVFEDFCGYLYYQRPDSMSKDPTKGLQSLKHILRARRLILDNSSIDIYPYAMRLWLSTYVNALNNERLAVECREECRSVLKKEKKNIHYLIKRQQFAAWMIIYVPWLHRYVYRIYSARR